MPEELSEKALKTYVKLLETAIEVDDEIINFIIRLSYGDGRIALNILEFAATANSPDAGGII